MQPFPAGEEGEGAQLVAGGQRGGHVGQERGHTQDNLEGGGGGGANQ